MTLAILFILVLCAGFSHGFFLGGSEQNGIGIPVQLANKAGFRQDQKVYSHLVIPPWSRPFKPGYCTSWEWNTDKRYREQRLAICNDLAKGKHECDSPSGFCKDKCPFTNGTYPYWRLRNAAEVPFLWVISSLQMYDTPFANKPLTTDPQRGYGSSYFGPGYKPSNAFDNNEDTLWISNGGAPPGMQWIAFEFEKPVFVGSIRVALEEDKPERSPSMIYVEASCEKYFKTFVTSWVINNPRLEADKRFNVFGQAKFTSLGANGRLGPVSIGAHYQGHDHEGHVSVHKGVQMWKVPAAGTYSIEAVGASGGYDKFSGGTSSKFRGRGARVRGNFKLKKGDILKILIGQEGQSNPTSGGAGGGGGSFVVREDNSPIIIGGGGGGVDKMKSESPRCHGSISQDGNPGYGGSMFLGGAGGRGAEEGDNGYSGGGGGGLKTNGRNNKNFGGSKGTGGEGGKGFTTGGVGGRSNQNHVDGGFGGGGGPNGAGGGAGGGGGYSGGASGSRSNSCGGGGGSFNTGADQLSKPGANIGHGYVVIKLVSFK
ncbi:hypothetical protein QZH41_014295 [Actinostola sp. cb2023]|nr:hypothetical protein QZH41_014295 [Actinostola sp. cb2023]